MTADASCSTGSSKENNGITTKLNVGFKTVSLLGSQCVNARIKGNALISAKIYWKFRHGFTSRG